HAQGAHAAARPPRRDRRGLLGSRRRPEQARAARRAERAQAAPGQRAPERPRGRGARRVAQARHRERDRREVTRGRRIALVVVGLLAGAALALAVGTRRQLPSNDVPRLPLSAPVDVGLDARGVPTVRAGSLADAMTAQGYLVARERMFQMELQRRSAHGALAELFGAAALPFDRQQRVYGFRRTAEDAVGRLRGD